jgi:hypothetical protein
VSSAGPHSKGRLIPMPSHLTTPRVRLSNGCYARVSPAQRFWAKVDKNGPVSTYAPHLGPCWLWTAKRDPHGCGRFWGAGQRFVPAPRFSYEGAYGPIPPGLELDHLCRTPSCVRPTHVEAVTHRENMLRGDNPSARCAKATHCKNGHAFDLLNTHFRPNGHRRCRTCAQARYARVAG